MARIVKNPEICGGVPTIEGTRLPVAMILEYLTARVSEKELLEQFPTLTSEGIEACLQYATATINRQKPARKLEAA